MNQTQKTRWKDDPAAYNRRYLKGYNATRRANRIAAGECVDCHAPSLGLTRCPDCRMAASAKDSRIARNH